MYIVGSFTKTKKLFNGAVPNQADFDRMRQDGTACILVDKGPGRYEYLECDLISTGNDEDVMERVKYICGMKHVSEWHFVGEGISCDKLAISPELQDALRAIMEPHSSSHNVGITICDGHVALVDYIYNDLVHFHYAENNARNEERSAEREYKTMKVCPKCGCQEFHVTQHVTQTVKVDGDGHFLSELTSCDEITHAADDDDIWTCAHCGYDAPGSEFNQTEGV